MEKLGSHIFEAVTQFLRSNKKQPNESTIMIHVSEELEEDFNGLLNTKS